jgi:hypothetical protein
MDKLERHSCHNIWQYVNTRDWCCSKDVDKLEDYTEHLIEVATILRSENKKLEEENSELLAALEDGGYEGLEGY